MEQPPPTRILVVDDEESLRHYLQLLLSREGYLVETAHDAPSALSSIERKTPDLILCDVRMPGEMDGLQLLSLLRERFVECEVIMMSAYGSRELAIEAVQRGAYDYIDKPIQRDDLLLTLQKLFERERLRLENQRLRAALDHNAHDDGLVASSKSMQDILQLARKVAPFPSSVLLQGENGTGKELLARLIHKHSPRNLQQFVPVNCGSIPENLFESQLFGHQRGAFTGAHQDHPGLFEEANGGTLFLDEISELPHPLQVKLLRVLQEGTIRRLGENAQRDVDVRILAATNKDLKREVEAGRFRQDLFYRLKVVTIPIPPLRQRKEDIPILTEYFIERLNARFGTSIQGVQPDVMRALLDFTWEGNVRQLKNCIESAMIIEDSPRISRTSLPPEISETQSIHPHPDVDEIVAHTLSIKDATRQLERRLIEQALLKTDGNRTAAARLLEISHRALLYKIKQYQLK